MEEVRVNGLVRIIILVKKHVRLPQKTQQSEINITKENHAITRLLEDLSSIMSLEALNRVAQANYQISDNQFHRC